MPTYNINNEAPTQVYDRRKELEEFDNTKLGVKGLVDSGLTRIPRIFRHSPEELLDLKHPVSDDYQNLIPIIDMSIPHKDLVQKMHDASAKFGFFMIVNHGVPDVLLNRVLKATRAFHELPPAEKMSWYTRDPQKEVGYLSNKDLFRSRAASWRDTFFCELGSGLDRYIDPNLLPSVCREEVVEYEKEVKLLGKRLMGLLSEGLGLTSSIMKGEPYVGQVAIAANYYPPCPEPNMTFGTDPHTDIGMITIVHQDHVGGLQMKYNDKWIDIKPVEGAFVINIADMFQIISNDEYKSVDHRVLANSSGEARSSIPMFLNPGPPENVYGPLPELVSDEKPALYKQFTYSEFKSRYYSKEMKGTMVHHFRL